MVPDLVDRFTEKKEDKVTEADVAEILDSAEKRRKRIKSEYYFEISVIYLQ